MEKRIYPRYPLSLPVKLETKDPNTKIHANGSGEFVDISLGGAGLSLDTPLEIGSHVKLWADLYPTKPVLSTEAKVKWIQSTPTSNRFRHGLQFLESDADVLKEALREINIHNIESFFGIPLPDHIKKNCLDNWVSKRLNKKEIMEVIDFEPPFLKIEKAIVFDSFTNGSPTHEKGITTGVVTLEDTKGHYNDTMFLALCGWLMASSASVHLAILSPKTVPQVIEANGVRPLLSLDNKKHIWKPAPEGTRFFVETQILRQKLRLAIVTTTITFSNVLFGVVDELKLIIDPRESILNATPFPPWGRNGIAR